jgi:lipid II:glycine glycyltransferase (peptidoglycan interpeptide bridge formation enzyme)
MTSLTAPAPAGLSLRRIEDRAEWNRLIQSLPTHDVRQSAEWGEVRGEEGWRPTRLAVLGGGRCLAACSLLSLRVAGAGAVLCSPRGPLADPGAPEALAALLEGVAAAAREQGGILVRFSPRPEITEGALGARLAAQGWVPLPETWTVWNIARHSQVLDLRAPEPELWRRIRRRQREYVTASERNGLAVAATDREEDLERFHALVAEVARRKGFPARDLKYFRAIRRHFEPAGGYTLLVARDAGRIVGGLLAVRIARFSMMLATAVEQGPAPRRHGVSPVLYWAYVRAAKAAGCEIADFGPSGVGLEPRESDAGWGVYRFKASFGCEFRTFPPFHDLVLRPARYRLFRMAETRVLPHLWSSTGRRVAAALGWLSHVHGPAAADTAAF